MPEAGAVALNTSASQQVTSTWSKVKQAMDNLTTLTIKTSIEGDEQARQMVTKIDLVAGDIENSMHQDFVSGDLKALQDFHAAQVLKGQSIIKENIAAVKAMLEMLKDAGLDREDA